MLLLLSFALSSPSRPDSKAPRARPLGPASTRHLEEGVEQGPTSATNEGSRPRKRAIASKKRAGSKREIALILPSDLKTTTTQASDDDRRRPAAATAPPVFLNLNLLLFLTSSHPSPLLHPKNKRSNQPTNQPTKPNRRHLHPRRRGGGRHRPPLLVPRGRLLLVRRQGRLGRHRPVRPVLPRRRPDRQGLRADVRRVPDGRLHDRHAPGGGALLKRREGCDDLSGRERERERFLDREKKVILLSKRLKW